MTPSPWLDIPLADYEAHMAHPSVGQSPVLGDLLESMVGTYTPASIAILGCAGGNGLDRAGVQRIPRVVGIDINPEYLAEANRRYAPVVPGLALHCADVESDDLHFAPVELIFAALLFEHVDIASTMQNVQRHCLAGGRLVAVLQLPQTGHLPVTPTPYPSLQRLAPSMKLVAPSDLAMHAAAAGFSPEAHITHGLPTGKSFSVQVFRAGR
jgi:hypothetical protein